MITEDYVSFETAKLLKDKGFNEPCLYYYFSDGIIGRRKGLKDRNCPSVNTFSMPTHQMVMKWLREVHNFHILVEPNHDKEGLYNAHVKVGWWSNNWAGVGYNTYEAACETAIKYCLENLKENSYETT